MTISNYTTRVLIASKVKGVGKKTLQSLSADPLFFQVELDKLGSVFPELEAFTPDSEILENAIRAADNDVKIASSLGHTILSPFDAEYPSLLASVDDRPIVLYVAGDTTKFNSKAIAIVGTRAPSPHGVETAKRITSYFSNSGWQIVSGLALGVDTAVHKATIDNCGSTVAVMAHGLDVIYPRQNAILAEEILKSDGLWVSEYGYGTTAFPAQFIERDRIQAGLSKAVLIVQSGMEGGSLHAGRAALSYGRYILIPVATRLDAKNKFDNVQANIILSGDSPVEKMSSLKCDSLALSRVLVIKSKDDYEEIEMKISI